MSEFGKENRNQDLGQRMRSDWDRRIQHDYRYWMSDGVDSDQLMWDTGERDFELLLEGLQTENLCKQTALELGCGVGRLLRAASQRFQKVIGVDVSSAAVDHAKRLLGDRPNVEVILGNGIDLDVIQDHSIDVAYTFAALSSMPITVTANYLIELSRVVKDGGYLRIQLYLGKLQETVQEDSIAIRGFEKHNFIKAVHAAGFDVHSIENLILPFEINDKAAGLTAEIVALKKSRKCKATAGDIELLLAPEGEQLASAEWNGSLVEYYMAIARGNQHIEAERIPEAIEAFEFAVNSFRNPDPGVRRMLEMLHQASKKNSTTSDLLEQSRRVAGEITAPVNPEFKSEVFEQNLNVIRDRFPTLFQTLQSIEPTGDVTIARSENGEIITSYRGKPLDNLSKPRRSGEAWIERSLNNLRAREAEALIVVGFGSGYHLDALRQYSDKKLYVYEPNVETLHAVLGARDCRDLLAAVAEISTSKDQFRTMVDREIDPEHTYFLLHPQTQSIFRDEADEIRRAYWKGAGLRTLNPSIAVVGPLHGGTLPISKYVARALGGLNQRVQYYDLSRYFQGFNDFSEYVNDKGRIATLQNNYVEVISQLVLEGIQERPVDILIALAQAPLSARVLTELRAQGVTTVMWFVFLQPDCLK